MTTSRLAIGTIILLAAIPAAAQPVTPLMADRVNVTITLENDASADRFGDIASIAPDLSVGVTADLTLSLVHSTFGRTGFRGAAGAGLCATDDCARAYDNTGLEGLLALRRGALSISANAGAHATSFDRGFYIAKAGAKLRYTSGRATITTLPSITAALTHRDAMPPNRDRLWLPVSAMVGVHGGLALGASTGFKAPLDDTLGDTYEVAAGLLATYTPSPALAFGASWVHGKLLGGDTVVPETMDGVDSRALQVWMSATY